MRLCLQGKDAAEVPSYSEPADESQPACAISGERFASFWHEASESWHFDDARRLFGEEAARYDCTQSQNCPLCCSLCVLVPCDRCCRCRYGVPSGSLVKASCLRPEGTPEPQPFVQAAHRGEVDDEQWNTQACLFHAS